uniref:NUDE_C domain-containing protein n=1 Tax=Schistosoma mansoni TaxID=6183 RepID=A0A5K4F338_SCHMA
MENPVFDDPGNEAKYWRQKAEEYRSGMEEAREELEDFQISSRELELELETQLEQLEKRNSELVVLCEKLTVEKDTYRHKAENSQEYVNHEITRLQDELEKSKLEREKMHRYIRELEQLNDDLERSKRAAVVTLEDFESRLNQAIERNAFLENELDEKEDLMVTVQRLKDETRDLHQELAITRRQPELGTSPEVCNGGNTIPSKSLNKIDTKDSMVQTENSCFFNSILTPSVRLSALNMVNNALQRIGQLEMKLSILYKTYGHPPLSAPVYNGNSDSNNCNIHSPSSDFELKRYNLKSPQRLSNPSWTNGPIKLDPLPTAEKSSRENSIHFVY